jgi:spore germination protein Q
MNQNPYYGSGFYQPSGTPVPASGQNGYYAQQPAQQSTQAVQGAQAAQAAQAQFAMASGQLPLEQSYIENILRLNKGKQATVFMTYERNSSLGTQSYTGIIEAAGRDHVIISDPESGKRYLLLMIYLDYVEFPGEINYLPQGQAATYPPRR